MRIAVRSRAIVGDPRCSGGRQQRALTFSQLGLDVRPALVNGAAGAVSFLNGEPFSVGAITIRGGKIVEIDFLADPARLRELDLTMVTD